MITYDEDIEWDYLTFIPYLTDVDGEQEGLVNGRRYGRKTYADFKVCAIYEPEGDFYTILPDTIMHERTCGNDDL